MLHCYMLALCAGSSVDRMTGAMSLFQLIDEISIPSTVLGQAVPVELHAYFFVDEESRSASFEMRAIRVLADGREDVGGPLPFKTDHSPRVRVRVSALQLPLSFGAHALRVEWRLAGTDTWHGGPARWPLVLNEAAVPTPGTLPEAP
jgi:hypothetical protein